jgi:hypothetical protein
MTNTHPPTNRPASAQEQARSGSDRSMRFWSKTLRLWSLCDNAACRRARACRGDVGTCMSVGYRKLPQGVREFYEELMGARIAKVPFDEAKAWLDANGHTRAIEEWWAAVDAGKTQRAGVEPDAQRSAGSAV